MEAPPISLDHSSGLPVPAIDPPTPSASRRAAPRHVDVAAAMDGDDHGAVRAPKVLSPGAAGEAGPAHGAARSSLQLDAPAGASLASPSGDAVTAFGSASMSPAPAATAGSSISTGATSPRAEAAPLAAAAAVAGPFALLHAVPAPRHAEPEPLPLWAGGAHARGFTAVNVPTVPQAPASNAGIGAVGASTDPLLVHFARGGVASLADEQFPGDVVARASGPDDVDGYRYPEFPAGGGITADMYQRLKREYARAGLVLRECTRAGVELTSKEAAEARDVLPPAYSAPSSSTDADGVVHSRATPYLKDPPLNDLPLESFDLRVIYERGRTGFEDDKEFPIAVGTVIAGRYKVTEFLGEAAFSRAVQAIDLKHNMHVCVKIIRNSKDFFDQSLDEVKLLHYINTGGDPDENCVVQLYDFFYFKEHMFLICELLRDNLYEFSKYNREHEAERYFTLPRLQSVTSQVLRALRFVHSLGLIHCDLKPENILIKSYSRCEVKVIDFGSSCFLTDNLTSYVQSRCYRAPEAILGCRYDGRIDIWSLGAIVAELATGSVLFANETVPGMLARIASIVGPFPPRMLREGRHSCRFFTKYGVLYEQFQPDAEEAAHPSRVGPDGKPLLISTLYFAQPTQLQHLVGFDDPDYVDFIRQCLTLDPSLRPTAEELLRHPFMTKSYQ